MALLSACAETPASAPPTDRVAAAPAAAACADVTFPIYFQRGSDQLTTEARQVILDGAARVRGCRFGPLDVVGLANADGPFGRNLALERRRAAVTAELMRSAGLPAPNFDIEEQGRGGQAKVARGARHGLGEFLGRRTEVTIHAAPPAR